LRAAPFVLSRFIRPLPGAVVETLDHMSFAIIGGLMGESLLAGDHLERRLLAIAAAFLFTAWLKKPLLIFYALFLAFYFVR
jgi:hypothetical protein